MKTDIEIQEIMSYSDMISLYETYSHMHDNVCNEFIRLKNFRNDIVMSEYLCNLYPDISNELLSFIKPAFKGILGDDYIYLDTQSINATFVKAVFKSIGSGTKKAIHTFIVMIKELIRMVFEKIKVAMNLTLTLTKISMMKLHSWEKFISKLPTYHKKDFEVATKDFWESKIVKVPMTESILRNYLPVTTKLIRECDGIVKNDVDTKVIDLWDKDMELIGIPKPPKDTVPSIVINSNLRSSTLKSLGFKPGFNGFIMAAEDFTKHYRAFVLAYGKIKRKEKEYLSRVDSIFHSGFEEKTEDRRNELERYCSRNFEMIMGYLSCVMDIGTEVAKAIRVIVAEYNNTMMDLKNKKHL